MVVAVEQQALPLGARALKRAFDVALALAGLLLLGWLILPAVLVAKVDTGTGLFTQRRIGRHGRAFTILKISTMRPAAGVATTVTTSDDRRITRIGRVLRRTKIDELPQLLNVLAGSMSFVGPRPDVPGFADRLEGPDRLVLAVRPGITGPASVAFRDEERLLARQADPEAYNRQFLYPQKVRLNCEYVRGWRFSSDLRWLWLTVSRRTA